MKNLIYSLLVLLSWVLPVNGQTHSNIYILPKEDTICYGGTLSLGFAGQSFYPLSYQWSNGMTSSTIQVDSSGFYSVTVTGYLGRSNNIITVVRTKTIHLLSKPQIIPITPLWVCKLDTVRLSTTSGYSNVVWNNGFTGNNYEKVFTSTGTGGATPDTVSVWYTAFLGNSCSVNSDTLMMRGIRRPEGLSTTFCDSYADTSGFVRCGIVLQYIYPVQYEVEFTDVDDTTIILTYFPPLGSRRILLNILSPGHSYYVRTRPIINNVTYCWGSTCTITLVQTPTTKVEDIKEIPFYDFQETKRFQVYDVSGKFLFRRDGIKFEQDWIRELSNQTYVIMIVDQENKVTYKKFNYIR